MPSARLTGALMRKTVDDIALHLFHERLYI